MNRTLFSVFPLLLTAVAVACGSSDGGGVPGVVSGPPVASADLPKAAANAVCSGLATCCASAKLPYQDAACHQTYESGLNAELAQMANLPDVTYSAAAAGNCVATLASIYASCAASPSNGDALNAACDGIFVGSLAAGAPCTNEAQCAIPTGTTVSCDGVCVVQTPSPHGRVGDPCIGSCVGGANGSTTEYCADGGDPGGGATTNAALCHESDGVYCNAGKCAALSPVGGPCADDVNGCVPESTCHAGKCVANPQVGQPCQDVCASGAYCNASGTGDQAFVCAALVADGAACAASFECAGAQCTDGTCASGSSLATANACAGQED